MLDGNSEMKREEVHLSFKCGNTFNSEYLSHISHSGHNVDGLPISGGNTMWHRLRTMTLLHTST